MGGGWLVICPNGTADKPQCYVYIERNPIGPAAERLWDENSPQVAHTDTELKLSLKMENVSEMRGFSGHDEVTHRMQNTL